MGILYGVHFCIGKALRDTLSVCYNTSMPSWTTEDITPRFIKLFWQKVDTHDQQGCWFWRASRDADGYGQVRVGKTIARAHRVAYFLAYGELPTMLDHTCWNRACCNHAHLRPTTNVDNSRNRTPSNRKRYKGRVETLKSTDRLYEKEGYQYLVRVRIYKAKLRTQAAQMLKL
jgi:hypothetical protein